MLSLSSLIVVSLLFLAKYFFGIFLYLRIIDYFRLKIDDLSHRLVDPTPRRGMLSIIKSFHQNGGAKRHPQIVNCQSSIFLFWFRLVRVRPLFNNFVSQLVPILRLFQISS